MIGVARPSAVRQRPVGDARKKGVRGKSCHLRVHALPCQHCGRWPPCRLLSGRERHLPPLLRVAVNPIREGAGTESVSA